MNKLVRDKIPQIIIESGRSPKYYVLSEEEYINELEKKLNEEVNEYQEAKNLEEIVDIIEVLYAICEARGFSLNELDAKRSEKAEERGRFKKRLFLEYIE